VRRTPAWRGGTRSTGAGTLATIVIILLVAACSGAIANPFATPEAPLAGYIKGKVAGTVHTALLEQKFSGAIVVEKDGAIVLRAGYGWANRDRRIPFFTTTIAQIGSLTKQFTATVIADLAREGKIDFQAPLSRYLDGVPERTAPITIEQLLTHTSGLPEACGEDFDRLTRDELVGRCLAQVELGPAGKFVYSNLGYSLLAAVVERIEKRPLGETLAARYFQPLGMQHIGYAFDAALQDSLARGYDDSLTVAPISDRLAAMDGAAWNLIGNGGIQASTEDMYTWYRALAQPSVLADAVKKVVMTPHATRDDGRRYGYGWFLIADAAGKIEQVSHTGGDGVFFAAFVWRPVDRLFYYIVTNSGNDAGADAARMVLRSFRVPPPTH